MKPMPKAERLAALVSNVTETMLGISFLPAAEVTAHPSLTWRTAIMLVDGPRPVSVGLSSDETGCSTLAAAMFGCKPDGVDVGMINDALCELVNMTAGLLKGALSLDQALGLPRVAEGDDPHVVRAHAGPHVLVLRAREVGLMLWVLQGNA